MSFASESIFLGAAQGTVHAIVQRSNTTDAAAYIGVAPPSLKNSRRSGTLAGVPAPAFIKIGRLVRYDRRTLDAWLAQFGECAAPRACATDETGGAQV